jgi:M6 family metalloprotease-like protein
VIRRLGLLATLFTITSCGWSGSATEPVTAADPTTIPTTVASTTTTVVVPALADDPRITPFAALADPNECKIPDITTGGTEDEVTSGFPRLADGASSLDDLDLLVIPVSVSDSEFDDTDLALVNDALDTVRQFFLDQSYGRVTVRGTVAPRESWVTLPGTAESTGMADETFAHDKSSIYREVVLAAADTLDLAVHDAIAVYAPADERFSFGQSIGRVDTPDGLLPYGVLMGGRAVTAWMVLAHEIVHAWLFSEDLYLFADQSQLMLGGWDLMEGSERLTLEINPWTRWINEWVVDAQVRCVTSPGETVHHLETISVASDLSKMIVVKLSDHSVLVIDSRRDLGFGVGGWDDNGDATIVYVVDTSIRHGEGPIRWRGELRTVGESLTTDGVTITLLDADATNDLVSVSVG